MGTALRTTQAHWDLVQLYAMRILKRILNVQEGLVFVVLSLCF